MDGTEQRYSVRANPNVANGAMVTRSFRLPKSVSELFQERVNELAADEDEPGITNATDALQDAVVRWLLIEGK